ncbi:MAG TPA: hypothetical protein VFU35_14340 [Jatrophihabitans sp.]|nr:hypothetical protein [Jatrophihabitans sp.]
MRIVWVGATLFGAGLVCIGIDMLIFAVGGHNTPLWLNLGCLAAPGGLLIAVGAALRAGRAEQRSAADQTVPID